MACPTCTHTLQHVGGGKMWWCPRCGTITDLEGLTHATYTPRLIERVQDLHTTMAERVGFSRWDQETWHRLGLFEAIYRPEDRP